MKLISLFTIVFLISGCYQWKGELNTRITGLRLKPGGDVVAIGIVEDYKRYPLFNMSGWSRGVPKIHGRKAKIYYYNIREKILEEKLSIKFPKGWDAGNHVIAFYVWDGKGIYFKLTGCPKKNRGCSEVKYYLLLSNGKINQLKELPIISGYIKGDSAYQTYQDGILAINIGHAGAWKPILFYKGHELIPIDED